MSENDRLRLISPPLNVISTTRLLIEQNWGKILDYRESTGFVEYQLDRNPWKISDNNDIEAKIFICMLVRKYYEIGWHLKISTDSKYYSSSASDVVIFERKAPLSTSVICISLNGSDKLRVFSNEDVLPSIKASILKFWPYGIEQEQSMSRYYEFKLNGDPWNSTLNNDIDSYFSSALINGILSALYHIGYVLSAAVDSGKEEYDVSSMYFRYDLEHTKLPQNLTRQFFAISLNKNNSLRLISVLPELIETIKKAMPHIWPNGIHSYKEGSGTLEIRLNGSPWKSKTGMESIETRQLIGNNFHDEVAVFYK